MSRLSKEALAMRLTQLSQIFVAVPRIWTAVASIHVACLTLVLTGCSSGDKELPTVSLGTEETPETSVSPVKPQAERPKFNPYPQVEVKTSAGSFTLKLDATKAPITVNNFLYYVNRGHYNGTLFHEVYRDSIALAGGFDVQLTPRPSEVAIRNEAHHGQKNLRGTIAMSRPPEAIDGATNQFFINLVDNPTFDHTGPEPSQYGYCVFGEVVSGMETVEAIGKAEVQRTEKFESTPATAIVIESMRQLK
jgi:peptidyl-prolyl cis-trans isomerase A (cyclophilin A)/peptidyl-prolyl cis-trans isomerase B (cyclophilin B)